MNRWCAARGVKPGATLTPQQVWALSLPWYAPRMQSTYEGRSAEEVNAIFREVGLEGSFWTV